MSAGELQEGKPVGRFLAPASADASAFGEPTESALNDPAAGGVLGFAGDRTEIDFGFATTPAVLDMGDIVFELEEVPDIGVVIAAVKTEMLFGSGWLGTVNHHGKDEVLQGALIVTIGCRDIDRQGCPAAVNQKVNLAAALATVS